MNKKNLYIICTVVILLFFCSTAGRLYRKYLTTRDDYQIVEKTISMEITDKDAYSQGLITKLFYTNDEVNYYFTISGKQYRVDKETFEKYNIGDTIDMTVETEYVGNDVCFETVTGISLNQ